MSCPLVSITICTRNRYKPLVEICLPSLKKINYPNLELLIIDSSSDIDERIKIEKVVNDLGGQYFFYQKKGLSNARNFAIRVAKGKYIAFTDDDCVVHPEWINVMLRSFIEKDVFCVTGKTISFSPSRTSEKMWEKMKTFDRGNEFLLVSAKDLSIKSLFNKKIICNYLNYSFSNSAPAPFNLGYGNNMLFKKSIFKKIGFFDVKLGRGVPTDTGEEVDIYYRLLKNNGKIVYNPQAVIFHRHRQSVDELYNLTYTAGLGTSAFFSKFFKDPFILLMYFGRLFNLLFSYINEENLNRVERSLILGELKGWLAGPQMYRSF